MPKIRIQCSECGHEARVPEQFRSRKVRCLRCHAKLRVPEDAPLAEPKKARQAIPRRPSRKTSRKSKDDLRRGSRVRESHATRGGPSSRTRREALSLLRELLHEYDHAIESVPRGLEVDLRGVAFGLARQLVEELLECRSIRDVKLAGGTGECRIVVTLQGWEFNPEDSFADDDDDTEIFQRGPSASGGDWTPAGLVDAVGLEDETDPAWHLQQDAPRHVPPESTMQPMFKNSSGATRVEPVKLFEQARELIEEGEPQQAIPLLEKAVKADMNFSRAIHALGKAYASIGDYHRARRAFRHLTKLEDTNPEAHVLYAASAVRCDRLEEAKLSLMTAIKLDPDYKQAYRYAAQLYDRLGEPEKSRKFRARYQALKLRG